MLELEDLRPETPSVGSVVSTREAILISLVLHLCLVIVYLLLPASVWGPDQATVVPSPSGDIVRFVQMDTPASKIPPKRPVQSDMNRRASSPVIPPKPDNPEPMSKGNSDDRSVATPNEKPRGPETPDPNAGAPTKSTPQPTAIDPVAAAQQPPGGGMLGQALRNFDRYTQNSTTFSNPTGGQDNAQAEINFDAMGVDFGPWLDRWVRMVKHNWLVPQAAMTMSGHVLIRLNIHKNGAMTDIEILEPSKISPFNSAAVQALKTSNPGIPLPTAYPVDPMVMTVIFYYNERPPIRNPS